MNMAFTICSANYLPFAKSLADSLIQHNPTYQFVIALADTCTNYDTYFFLPHQIVSVAEMAILHFEELNERYNIFELSCALKPSVAQYILNNSACSKLFYFDSDIMLFGALLKAESVLDHQAIVLTPHVTKALAYEYSNFIERNLLRTGLYNAGFFGISRSTESWEFLKWWEERLRYQCFNDAAHGLFVDQLWLNLSALYFKNTYILHDPGYNVAYWNFAERKIASSSNSYLLNESYPLTFFHFSGYNVFEPQVISKHRKGLLLENVPEYSVIFEEYRASIMANNVDYYFALPVTLGKQSGKKKEAINFQYLLKKIFKSNK